MLVIMAAEITVLFNYFELCRENYHWWWCAFSMGGSSGICVLLSSIVYFKELEANSFAAHVIYFGCMGLESLGLFLMTGFVGVITCLWFNKAIFKSMKINQESSGAT